MGLDMYLSYRRNLDGIPETIQRAMRKQAYTDRYPYLAEHFDKTGELDTIIDHHIKRSEPYEEELMYCDTVNEMRTHGVPESQETSFLRLGLDRIIDLIRNTVPSDTTN